MSRIYRENLPNSERTEGGQVECIHISEERDLWNALEKKIKFLMKKEGLSPENIAVLTAYRPNDSITGLTYDRKLADHGVTSVKRRQQGHIILDTIHNFKGLESPVVILCGLRNYPCYPTPLLMYTGVTRATSHLIILETRENFVKLGLTV